MRPAKIAIVGCGLVTDKHHLPAALQPPHVDLAALVDRDLKRARLLARKYGCRCVLSDKLEKGDRPGGRRCDRHAQSWRELDLGTGEQFHR